MNSDLIDIINTLSTNYFLKVSIIAFLIASTAKVMYFLGTEVGKAIAYMLR
ncbi:hypothetical protein [Cellulosilyticum lentocellum]|uniref:Uncharacterized protein n=1 Tax=Cellulosilyticum lentocellum (strain ATCC 49066 / DSM 5427 / NCIMB 11756 / RHM5) TaxID=642492 RepID=F2JGF0_CELLD|nr:hypothetical protein [Cellulosilyticum lentocellum]ADZ81845.1 hypothetical protein Clole_0085 [Cellulosilyticum lentocellum DSM 5427]